MENDRRVRPEAFDPIPQGSAVRSVLDQIVDLVRTGGLPLGSMLPGERQLATAMQVSRGTIREALEILADGGVVSVTPGRAGGTRIVSVWIPEALERSRSLEKIETGALYQLLEARRVIEPRVAQLAALRGADEDYRVMRESIELLRANQEDGLRVVESNAIFHRRLWRASRNPELERAMQSIYRGLSSAFSFLLREDRPREVAASLQHHEETLRAIMGGHSAEIEEAMSAHLADLERCCEELRGRALYPELPGFLSGGRTLP
jgi:DNA-binding FadR family transcriptional regulator